MKFKSIRNIKIKTKLLLLGLVSILGLVFIGAESIITARQINQASTDISESWMPSIIIAEELNTATSDYRIKEYYHVISHDTQTMQALETEMAKIREKIRHAFAEYENYIADDTDRELMEQAGAYWKKYLEYSEELLAISRVNETATALDLIIGDSRELFDDASNMLLAVADYNRKGAEEANVKANQLYEDLARIKIITISLIALVIALLVIYIIIAIDKPVHDLVEGTRRVSNGDLDVHLDYKSEDEIGILTDSVNQLIERLKNIINDEKYLFQEIGSENFEVKSTCQQAYRGDFAPILYSITSLMSRLDQAKKHKQQQDKKQEQKLEQRRRKKEQKEEKKQKTKRDREEESPKSTDRALVEIVEKESN